MIFFSIGNFYISRFCCDRMMIKKTKLAADMTTEGAMVCQRCYQALPKGVTLTFVKNGDNARRGRNCCPGCLEHYRLKKAGLLNHNNENDGMHCIFTQIRKILTGSAVGTGRSIWKSGLWHRQCFGTVKSSTCRICALP